MGGASTRDWWRSFNQKYMVWLLIDNPSSMNQLFSEAEVRTFFKTKLVSLKSLLWKHAKFKACHFDLNRHHFSSFLLQTNCQSCSWSNSSTLALLGFEPVTSSYLINVWLWKAVQWGRCLYIPSFVFFHVGTCQDLLMQSWKSCRFFNA